MVTSSYQAKLSACLIAAGALLWPVAAGAQCPQRSAVYADLESWVHSGSGHYLQGEVTMINPATAAGSHFFTSWGQACMSQGVGNFGQCALTSNPSIAVFFSDRKGSPADQAFAVNPHDQHVVSLDMVRNQIFLKSLTWNFTKTFTNVTRKGNVVTGADNDGSMIIINLRKATTVGNVLRCAW